jgi:hypothetical protein
MPAQRGELVLVSIPMPFDITLRYVWRRADAIEVLGQTLVTTGLAAGMVIGANNITPAKATRQRIDGTDSSFCATASRAAATAAGWTVGQPRQRRVSASGGGVARYVDVNGVKYGFKLSAAQNTALSADFAVLGVEPITSADIVVVGASFPKPPTVAKKTLVGSRITRHSTFASPTALDSLPAGYEQVKSGNFIPS